MGYAFRPDGPQDRDSPAVQPAAEVASNWRWRWRLDEVTERVKPEHRNHQAIEGSWAPIIDEKRGDYSTHDRVR